MSRSGRKRTCARVETSLPHHKRLKRIPLGPRRGNAIGVWLVALCHSRFQELDGFCPTEALYGFAGDEAIQDLVDVGLFARGEQDGLAGVVIVNYAEFNDTKADVDDRLQRDRVRKDRTLIPRGIRSDSHPLSAVKPVEKSGVEKDLISDSDARATEPTPTPTPSPSPTPKHSPPSPAPVHVAASGHGTFGMHVDAYGDGIRAVTRVPYVKSGPFEAKMLEECARRAGGLTGRELLAWYREKAEKFARSVNPRFGYSAHRFVAWLNGGERTDSAASAAPTSGPTRDLSRPESRNLNNLGAGLPPLPPLRTIPHPPRGRGRRGSGAPPLKAAVRVVPDCTGRVPPHDLDAEAAVLSASLLSASALGRAVEILTPEHFYSEAHRRVFEAAMSLSEAATPVDLVTVAGWLKDRDRLAQIGGMPYLHEILGAAPALGPAEVDAYARIVFDKWRLRALIETCHRVAAEGYTDVGDLETFLDGAEARVHQATSARGKAKTVQTLRAAAKDAFAKIRAHAENRGAILGIRTGFDRLDRALGGMHAGDLLIFAGRPAMGKTSLVMNIAVNVALQGLGAYVFSVEMPNEQLAMRAICSEARVNLSKARSNGFTPGDWPKLTEATLRVTTPEHLYLDEDSSVTVLEMRSRLREHQRIMEKAGMKLGVVAVDYLQLVRGDPNAETREQEVAEIARGLKAIAKEFKVPVLSLAQLNRAVEARTDKRPKMSDLRDSGAIEQDADVVVMLYRDDYYDQSSKEPGVTELIVTKQRNGPTGTFKVGFEAACTRFFNLDEREYCE